MQTAIANGDPVNGAALQGPSRSWAAARPRGISA